jgi:tetratricopeptide (TPR) repeat protein
VDPAHAHVEAQYVAFMETADDQAGDTSAEAPDANLLGACAYLLDHDRNDPDEAETYYKRAIQADPHHARNLGNYAQFLLAVRHDPNAAEPLYKQAVEANPNHARNLGDDAGILFANGTIREGLRYLEMARWSGPEFSLTVELAFYEYAHDPDPAHRQGPDRPCCRPRQLQCRCS